MRVFFVNRFCHPDHSATSQMLSDLAAGLCEKGWAITMVASNQGYDSPGTRLASQEQWRGVDIERISGSGFGRGHLLGRLLDYLTFLFILPFVLFRIVRRGDLLVAKTDPPMVSVVVWLVAKMRGAVLVNWLQDLFPEVAVNLGTPRVPRSLAWGLRLLRNGSLRSASMNVAIGSRMAEYLLAQGALATRVRVIHNWANEGAISPVPASRSDLRKTLGLCDQFVVGYSGNLGRAHDVETLLDAAQRLGDGQAIAFLIIGGGKGYADLQEGALQAKLSNMWFLPYQPLDSLSDSMAAADLHLVTLRPELEGQIVPSKFYGIAAAARPIGFIGDPDGEVARLVRRGECGFCVQPGRGDLLARAIIELAADPERCRIQGSRARALLDSSLSRELAHRKWHELLSELRQNESC